MVDDPRQSDGITRRATNLLLTAVIAVAFIGFFVGIDYGVPRPDSEMPEPTPQDVPTDAGPTVLPARSYTEIHEAQIGPTRRWRHSLDALAQVAPMDVDELIVVDPEEKSESLDLRSQRRAYNGAPPIIPHEVNQLGNDTCLVCHGEGFKLENRTARQLPHPYLANCMQCHVPPAPGELEPTMLVNNTFDGVAAPFEGDRAWTGAPPVVPHSTWMRDNCQACHGPTGWPGMETTHPWRQNCLQCHAPSAELDRIPSALTRSQLLPPPEVGSE